MSAVFDQHPRFFRPLVSKYRAQMAACLHALYQRLYGDRAEVVHSLSREFVLETFQEALNQAPELESDLLDEESQGRFQSAREQALWFLQQLTEAGWLHRQIDDVTLATSIGFTRSGRQFAAMLGPGDSGQAAGARAHHRNTRQVRNALRSFRSHGDVYDLLDAWDYSARILADFTDVIEELDERRRALVHEMRQARDIGQASADFFDFMEQRFQPDIAIRLSADNVEKHRTEILQEIDRIRHHDRAFKQDAEQRLRELMPDQIRPGESLLWQCLDTVERRLKNAAEIMLPALRRALQNFTKRADIVIRQLNHLSRQQHADVAAILQNLSALDPAEQRRRLDHAADAMASVQVALPDPDQWQVQARRRTAPTNYRLADVAADPDAERDAYVAQAEAQAFSFNEQELHRRLSERLAGRHDLDNVGWPVDSAQDLLAVAHLLSAGNLTGWTVEPTGNTVSDEWFARRDGFRLRRPTNTMDDTP